METKENIIDRNLNENAELYLSCGSCLNESLLHMTTYEWEESLKNKSDKVREEAATLFFDVKDKRDRWLNATLESIIKEIDKNKDKLKEGINKVNQFRQTFEEVEKFLQAVTELIGIVVKVLAFF